MTNGRCNSWASAGCGICAPPKSAITRANGRALIDEWIALQGSWHPIAWRPEILARRITSWLSQAPLVLQRRRRAILPPLHAQPRAAGSLSAWHVAGEAREGAPRLQAVVALAYAALCLERQQRHLRGAVKRLIEELQKQNSLPTAAISAAIRSALIELLLDLLPLRQAFASRNVPPPDPLLNALDRMMPMIRFMLHGDGRLALFNGGPKVADGWAQTLLSYDDGRNKASQSRRAGYQRIACRQTLLLQMLAAPPAALR